MGLIDHESHLRLAPTSPSLASGLKSDQIGREPNPLLDLHEALEANSSLRIEIDFLGFLFDSSNRSSGGKGNKNFAPRAADDNFQINSGSPLFANVLDNDDDRNGDPLQVIQVNGYTLLPGIALTLASGASLTIQADGSFFYDPKDAYGFLAAGESAIEEFSYRASDGRGGIDDAVVSVTVMGEDPPTANQAPVAVDDHFTVEAGAGCTGDLLQNDYDNDGDALTVLSFGGQAAGSSQILASGASLSVQTDGRFVYQPGEAFAWLPAGQTVVEEVSYTVEDGRGATATATVRFAVTGTATEQPLPYYVEALLAGDSNRWNAADPVGTPVAVTYMFLEEVPSYYGEAHFSNDEFRPFSLQQRDSTRSALEMIESYSGLEFVEVTDISQAAMAFGIAALPLGVGGAYLPSGDGIMKASGDVWMSSSFSGDVFEPGSGQYKTLIHEIGHALGLDHPSGLSGEQDTRKYTVMSYAQHPTAYQYGDVQTHMSFDIATIQHLYGQNLTASAGDDVYRFETLNNRVLTVWDSGGIDTFDLSAATRKVSVDLRPGHFSTVASAGSANVGLAIGTVIENALGGMGDDTLIGNAAANRLSGGAGRDQFHFDVGGGADVITDFQRGEDKIVLAQAARFADLSVAQGFDGAVVSIGEDQIKALGVTDLTEDDFLFALA